MSNRTRRVLLVCLTLGMCVGLVTLGRHASMQTQPRLDTKRKPSTRGPVLDNYDIRLRRPVKDTSTSTSSSDPNQLRLEVLKPQPPTPGEVRRTEELKQSMAAAQSSLAARLPGLKVDYSDTASVPEIVRVDGPGALANFSNNGNEATLRGFLNENAAMFGMSFDQATELAKVSDYTNPAGNLSFVELQQQVNGFPIFQGYVRGIFSADGRLMRTTGLLASGVPRLLESNPQLTAAQAVVAGANSINISTTTDGLIVLRPAQDDARVQVVSGSPFDEDVKTELVYFPIAPGNIVLAYQMTLWQPHVAYIVLVNAKSGTLLWRKNITQDQTQTVTYNVYNDDSPTPLSPTTSLAPPAPLPPGISRSTITLISENPTADNLGWIPDGAGNAVTTGNNCDAGLDVAAPNGIDTGGRATATGRVFNFDYIPDGAADPTGSNTPSNATYRMGIVTNLFFWTNRYHDLIYNFGFTEASRNFQTDNFIRGGLGNDFVRAEAQDSGGTNNANFSTPADGALPRMQMFIFTTTPVQRDGDLDMEVIFHELTHGTSNRLHANATGLNSTESVGMGEGWSDFYGRALLSSSSEDVNALYASGAYVTKNYYYGIRRFPYAVRSNVGPNGKPHNPLTFADIDPAQINLTDGAFAPAFNTSANEVHAIGEVWANTLLEVRAKLINNLGYAAGNPKSIQIVTDGMKLDPANPTLVDSRNSVIAANCSGFAGANELDVWEGFRLHGLGFRAGYKLGPDGVHVSENFDGPNLTLGTVVASEVTGNGNGLFDPGETVSLTLPVQNTLCANSAVNATATLSSGGGSVNYGTVNPGASASQSVNFTIPTATACGSAITFDITVNSDNLGPINYQYTLPIGQATPLTAYQNFDGVTAPSLPAGWTTSHTGASLGWATTTTNPDTAPNAVSTSNPANLGTGSITSPAIPVDTAQAKVSFRNLYNLENGFDSLTMQINFDGGPFQDIITAGGSFISGGYNANIGWTGLSGGTAATPTYITSAVNLPPSANGHVVRLRWTVIADANTIATGAAGASIDSIQLSTTTQACATFGAATATIAGRITDPSTVGLPNIQVTLSGGSSATATTDATGNYIFNSVVIGGNYTVTPTTAGYEYTPANRVFNSLAANVTNADFTAIPAAGIAGRVTTWNGAQGIDGITVTLSGSSSASTTTSNGGFYAFSPLTRFGNYTVTPSGGVNNIFTPTSLTYNSLNSAVTDANFKAVENLECLAIGSPITGTIAAGDTTQANRITRDGSPTTCGPAEAYPGTTAVATIRYDTHTFTNTSGSTECIKVTVAADFSVHSSAYLNSYDPVNPATNYLGDLGISYGGTNQPSSYFISVPAGATYVIVVNETALNAGGNYTLSLCSSSAQAASPAPAAQQGQVLITEFRQSVGATTSSNEYVELYNNTDAPISIGGYGLALFNATFGGDVVLGLPATLTIPRRGHVLIVNTAAGGYSLTAYAAADLSHANANLMPDNQGFGLINAARNTLIDSVGFVGNGGALAYIEGQGLRTTTGARPNVEHAWVRRISNTTTYPQDTDNNAADFQLVSVTAASFNAAPTPILSILGAPNPENLSSPIERSAVAFAGLVDPTSSPTAGENRVRFLTCGLPNGPVCPIDTNTSTNGYLSIRRRITNSSGAAVTRLRFRIVDITTLNSPGAGPAQADLRALTSGPITVTVAGNPVSVLGTTLDEPPTQALGGGLNSSMRVGTITLGTPLANGASANVQFMLGVQQTGAFRFWVTVDALP
jgi:hypothetical protein